MISINGSDTLIAAYPQIVGHYHLQPNTYIANYPFYAKTGNSSGVYIFYTGDHWAVSELYRNNSELLFTDSTNETTSPDKVRSTWKALNGAQNTTVTCKSKNVLVINKKPKGLLQVTAWSLLFSFKSIFIVIS